MDGLNGAQVVALVAFILMFIACVLFIRANTNRKR
jgi:cbb3-type cytochrome oxidase subunit 3